VWVSLGNLETGRQFTGTKATKGHSGADGSYLQHCHDEFVRRLTPIANQTQLTSGCANSRGKSQVGYRGQLNGKIQSANLFADWMSIPLDYQLASLNVLKHIYTNLTAQ
jgi:hypothetical protein